MTRLEAQKVLLAALFGAGGAQTGQAQNITLPGGNPSFKPGMVEVTFRDLATTIAFTWKKQRVEFQLADVFKSAGAKPVPPPVSPSGKKK